MNTKHSVCPGALFTAAGLKLRYRLRSKNKTTVFFLYQVMLLIVVTSAHSYPPEVRSEYQLRRESFPSLHPHKEFFTVFLPPTPDPHLLSLD